MATGDENLSFQLGAWCVEPGCNRLFDGSEYVSLEPRIMGVLFCLAGRQGKTVSTDELLETVWHGRAHADNTVYQAVTELRKILGDNAQKPRYIETIAKKGYRLIETVRPVAEEADKKNLSVLSSGDRQYKSRAYMMAASIAVAAIAAILFAYSRNSDQPVQRGESYRYKSVAVLPFVDLSEDGNQQFLSDGISEELIHALSNLQGLRVTARTSSFAFRNSDADIRQIGSQLNVATILEGSIRRDGDRIRVAAQLVDAHEGFHLWSRTFDRDSSDLFRIQNEIAVAVAKSFEYSEISTLASDNRAARPDELKAYDFYLLGLSYLYRDSPSDYVIAIENLERAIELDPGFARAHASLAQSYADLYWYEATPDLLRQAQSAAEYALLLDDQSGDAYRALGDVNTYNGNRSGAKAAYVTAIELNPNDVRARASLADAYNFQGELEEAVAIMQQALERNPISGQLNNVMGTLHYSMKPRDWALAWKYFERAMRHDPDHPYSYNNVGNHFNSTGQLDRAIPYFKKVDELTAGPTKVGLAAENLALLYVDIGDYDSAAQVIRRTRELEPQHFAATNSEIQLLLARGDFSTARDIVHSWRSENLSDTFRISLMAAYESFIGDADHAEDLYSYLESAKEFPSQYRGGNLYRYNELGWGTLGAVNLAHLRKGKGNTLAAQELLSKAREFIESENTHKFVWFDGSVFYVLAQISAIEGNDEVALDYFRSAVARGWIKPWFGRIDPIMADLRKDARFMQILEDLEDKLLKIRANPPMLISSEPQE